MQMLTGFIERVKTNIYHRIYGIYPYCSEDNLWNNSVLRYLFPGGPDIDMILYRSKELIITRGTYKTMDLTGLSAIDMQARPNKDFWSDLKQYKISQVEIRIDNVDIPDDLECYSLKLWYKNFTVIPCEKEGHVEILSLCSPTVYCSFYKTVKQLRMHEGIFDGNAFPSVNHLIVETSNVKFTGSLDSIYLLKVEKNPGAFFPHVRELHIADTFDSCNYPNLEELHLTIESNIDIDRFRNLGNVKLYIFLCANELVPYQEIYSIIATLLERHNVQEIHDYYSEDYDQLYFHNQDTYSEEVIDKTIKLLTGREYTNVLYDAEINSPEGFTIIEKHNKNARARCASLLSLLNQE